MFEGGAVAELVLAELSGGARQVDDYVIEGLADWMDSISADGTVEGMAKGMGREIVEIPGLPVRGIHVPGKVVIAPHHCPCERRFTIAHELSHVEARENGFNDCHGDVQRLALAALIPSRVVRSLRTVDVVVLAAAVGAPCWAAWARLKMSSVHAMLRAA